MRKFVFWLLLAIVLPFAALAGEAVPVRVSYVPNIAFAPAFVIKGEGWDTQEGLDVQLQKFPAAPFALQAFMAGQLDVLYTILSSVIALGDKAQDLRVIAAVTRNNLSLEAVPELARLKKQLGPVEAIKRYAAEKGRKPRVLLFARGIMSDILFRKWVHEHPGLSLEDFEITNIAGQDQLLQAAIAGDYDLLSLFEPLVSIVKNRGVAIEPFLPYEEFMKNHPVAVLATSQAYINQHPNIVAKMKMLNQRAIDFIQAHPEQAAVHISKWMATGNLDQKTIADIVARAGNQYNSDLDAIEWSARQIADFMVTDGLVAKPADIGNLFWRGSQAP